MDNKTIFVWRSKNFRPYGYSPHLFYRCPCCGTITEHRCIPLEEIYQVKEGRSCPLCGWYLLVLGTYLGSDISREKEVTLLKEFNLDSPSLALDELATYLKLNFADIFSLSWRRFEELVFDIFKTHGYKVCLTQPTKDDGADVIVLHNDGNGRTAIIECKKYAKGRKIGVALVRTLVGAAVDWEVRRAYLVTTSDFSSGAQDIALNYKDKGYEIDLIAASDLLILLDVYNTQLPSLHNLTDEWRREIVFNNRGAKTT